MQSAQIELNILSKFCVNSQIGKIRERRRRREREQDGEKIEKQQMRWHGKWLVGGLNSFSKNSFKSANVSKYFDLIISYFYTPIFRLLSQWQFKVKYRIFFFFFCCIHFAFMKIVCVCVCSFRAISIQLLQMKAKCVWQSIEIYSFSSHHFCFMGKECISALKHVSKMTFYDPWRQIKISLSMWIETKRYGGEKWQMHV